MDTVDTLRSTQAAAAPHCSQWHAYIISILLISMFNIIDININKYLLNGWLNNYWPEQTGVRILYKPSKLIFVSIFIQLENIFKYKKMFWPNTFCIIIYAILWLNLYILWYIFVTLATTLQLQPFLKKKINLKLCYVWSSSFFLKTIFASLNLLI